MTEDESILSRLARQPDLELRYGSHPEHVADVYLPPRAVTAGAAVLAFHGGFWRQRYDRSHLAPLAESLAAAGHLIALVEYRRVGGDGGWPNTFDDVALACATLPRLLAQAAPSAVAIGADGEPLAGLVGHSAGGQLVFCAASNSPPSGLVGVVALAPVANLVTAWQLGLGEGAVEALLGGSPDDVPDRFAATDPMQQSVPSAPVTVLHGADDNIVPIELSRSYVRRALGLGAPVDLVELSCAHFELIDPTNAATAGLPLILEKMSSEHVERADRV